MNGFIKMNILCMLAALLFTTACKYKTAENKSLKLPLPTVIVKKPFKENKIVYTEFRAVSRYLQTVNFRARIAGIITATFAQPGDEIKVNQPLFVVKPVELSALENAGSFSSSVVSGFDTIFSGQNAFTNRVMVQVGDYVQPGSLLASAFKKNSLVAVVYVPFAQVRLIHKNSPSIIEIPGKGDVKSYFEKQLYVADSVTQTQPFIVPLPFDLHLSANMNLWVRFKEREIHQGTFVLRKAILTNEEENSFWVMKMINDSTAVKIDVTVGWQGKKYIQVLSGNLSDSDRILTDGAYGLPDTAYVQIIK